MLTFPATVRIFLAAGPTDLRKGFDGLMGLAQQIFAQRTRSLGADGVFRPSVPRAIVS